MLRDLIDRKGVLAFFDALSNVAMQKSVNAEMESNVPLAGCWQDISRAFALMRAELRRLAGTRKATMIRTILLIIGTILAMLCFLALTYAAPADAKDRS